VGLSFGLLTILANAIDPVEADLVIGEITGRV